MQVDITSSSVYNTSIHVGGLDAGKLPLDNGLAIYLTWLMLHRLRNS